MLRAAAAPGAPRGSRSCAAGRASARSAGCCRPERGSRTGQARQAARSSRGRRSCQPCRALRIPAIAARPNRAGRCAARSSCPGAHRIAPGDNIGLGDLVDLASTEIRDQHAGDRAKIALLGRRLPGIGAILTESLEHLREGRYPPLAPNRPGPLRQGDERPDLAKIGSGQ